MALGNEEHTGHEPTIRETGMSPSTEELPKSKPTFRLTFTRSPHGDIQNNLCINGSWYSFAEEGELSGEGQHYAYAALEQAIAGKEKGKLEITTF